MPSNAPWKPDITAKDLIGACTFNALFTTLAVADYSADLWAGQDADGRMRFLSAYVQWRAQMPIVGSFLLVLLVFLPFIILGMGMNALQAILGWRKATAVRHCLGTSSVALPLPPYLVTLIVRFACRRLRRVRDFEHNHVHRSHARGSRSGCVHRVVPRARQQTGR